MVSLDFVFGCILQCASEKNGLISILRFTVDSRGSSQALRGCWLVA